MPNPSIISRVQALQEEFTKRAQDKRKDVLVVGPSADIVPEPDYKPEAERLSKVIANLEKDEYSTALMDLFRAEMSLSGTARELERISDRLGSFDSDKRPLKTEADTLKTQAKELKAIYDAVEQEEESLLRARAEQDPAALGTALERFNRDISRKDGTEHTVALAELLALAAKHLTRQDAQIKEMAGKIASLEKQLADLAPQPLDKPHLPAPRKR